MQVQQGRVVAMRYIMRNSRNEVLENNMNSTPVSYLHGAGGILPLLQAQVEGLCEGDKKLVFLGKESGLVNDDFSFEIIIDEVRQALEQELLLGYPVQPPAAACNDDCDCYMKQHIN